MAARLHPCSLGATYAGDAQATQLAERFRLLHYDQRGHGDSEVLGPYEIADLGRDVLSIGGMTGMWLLDFAGPP